MKNYLFCLCFVLFLLTGCGRQVPVLRKLAPLPGEGICKIAVLPFIDEASYPQGAEIVNKIFLSELVATGKFRVFPEGNILEMYRQLLLYPTRLPNREQLEMIGGRLNPDIFVGGIIQKMQEKKSTNFVDTELTLILQIYDGNSGQLLWVTYHRRRGSDYQQFMHMGRINTLSGLARQMSQEVITDWFKQGMISCNN